MNIEPHVPILFDFLEVRSLYNHMKAKTCWKSENGTCIDLIISNSKFSIMNTGVLETGLSDHHLLIFTMLKTQYERLPPKTIKYRKWKNFDEFLFRQELVNALNCNLDYKTFEQVFELVLNRHAPMRTKFLRGNSQPHLNPDLRKAIMKRSKLKRRALLTKSAEDMAAYKKQRNLVVNKNRQAKKAYFMSVTQRNSNQNFWKTVKPFFSEKGKTQEERILLVDNGKVISDDSEIATMFNGFFNKITETLDLPRIPSIPTHFPDPIDSIIATYDYHPSVINIKRNFETSSFFEFQAITEDMMIKEILALNSNKKSSGPISVKALKLAAFECAGVLTEIFNRSLLVSLSFPKELKLADIIPIHKKGPTTDMENYRPVSLLPTISKVFERLIAKQLEPFLNRFLSKFLCGFRKGLSCQYALLNMIRKWQSCLNSTGKVGAILMDLSKAFDCLPHDLLIAKMAAYGFGKRSLTLVYSYLSDREHRVRIGSCLSDFINFCLGVPQGSVLGPIFFNIFINDLLFSVTEADVCNLADDNTLYVCDTNLQSVLKRLNTDLKVALDWFSCNGLVANPSKFQLIFPGNENDNIEINIGHKLISSTKEVKLLGITIDSQLTFYSHVRNICKQASSKIKAILRIRGFLTQFQTDLLVNAFILSSLNYCPLVWMFCSKQAHNLISSTHHRALSAKVNCHSKPYHELLKLTGDCTIHTRNLRLLVIEIFKTLNFLNPEIMWDTFPLKSNIYKLRQGSTICIPKAKTVKAINYFDFRAAMAWNHLSNDMKCLKTLSEFKRTIKTIAIYCQCRNCK